MFCKDVDLVGGVVECFCDEVCIFGLLNYCFIVKVDGFVEFENGWVVVMEYVLGVNIFLVGEVWVFFVCCD